MDLLVAIASLLVAAATFTLAFYTWRLAGETKDVAKAAVDQAAHTARAATAAETSANAADAAVGESIRARLDALAPRVVAFCAAPDWPPLFDPGRSRMPFRNELRLLAAPSLQGTSLAINGEYVFDRDKEKFLWFCCQGLLRNEGAVSARVRLNGEAQFIKLRTDEPADPMKRQRLPLSSEEPLDQERVLLPEEEVLFEWAGGRPLGEWADAFDNQNPPSPHSALFFYILISDPTGLSVTDHIFIEAAGRPIERLPGTNSNWRPVSEQAMRAVVYPTVRRYGLENEEPPKPPWTEVYG
jgi:hypothetical protein